MNAYMNIQVRVISAAARAQIKQLQAQVAGLEGQLATANATSSGAGAIGGVKQRASLQKWGNQLQWTGRQLQYNWTLPLLLAGGAAAKWQLDNEKAFTQVSKVYGDTQAAAAQFNKEAGKAPDAMYGINKAADVFEGELAELQKAFAALSSHYGINQKEVTETAGAWAAAGASGVALAKSTELSIKASILGNMDLAKSTEALIAIQSQYSLSTGQLNLALAEMNAIENQTGISMQGLIEGFSRSAGVAREAGVDVRHLGAMLAALVPATGSASTAGNALKTIISRLMSPTAEAAQVMKEFGVNTADAAWNSSTAMERLEILAGHMNGTLAKTGKATEDLADDGYKLSDSQKQVVASVLGSRYQMNRFLVLMRELGPEVSYYEKALAATEDRTKSFAQMHQELDNVLKSNPKRLEIIWYSLQNGMANAIQPMIPYILYLANSVRMLVEGFGNLDPGLQKLIILFGLGVAMIGPLLKYFGSLMTLLWAMGRPLRLLGANFSIFGHVMDDTAEVSKIAKVGLGSLFMTIIKAPFKYMGIGVGFMIGQLTLFARKLGITTAVQKAWGTASVAITGATATAQAAISSKFWTGLTQLWVKGYMALAMVTTQGWGALLAMQTAWFIRITAASRAKWAILAGNAALFGGALKIALMEGLAGAALAVMGFGANFGVYFARAYTWVLAQTAIFGARLSALHVLFSQGIPTVYAVTYVKIATLTSSFHGWMTARWIAFQTMMISPMARFGTIMSGIWAAMHTRMAMISAGFWTMMTRGWIIGMTGILKAPKLLAGGLKVVWGNILMAIRLFGKQALKLILGPWGWVAVAVIAILTHFRDQIGQVWNNILGYFSDSTNEGVQWILKAWNLLPSGIQNALVSVVTVVRDAALAVYEWFSYINPFAHHSPSLVENAERGMARVGAAFAKGNAQTTSNTNQMKASMKALKASIEGQEAVVAAWEDKLEAANDALDRQQAKLESLRAVADRYKDKLDEANQRLSDFASAPIEGMRAMEDRIFANEMAQKRLRLEMMKLEDATGGLDEMKQKMDDVRGAQELLTGRREELRQMGAGSDILGTYDDEISKLKDQQKEYSRNASELEQMQSQLDDLGREAERLDLIKSLRFDELARQIEQAADRTKELSFEEIMAGIRGANADIDKYGAKWEEANRAVERQQKVVDAAEAARDKIADALDREQEKLDKLKDAYGKLEEAARKADEARSKGPKEYVTPGLKNFRDAKGGNFANVGGAGIPTREDWASEAPDIKEWVSKMEQDTADMFGDLNPFAPIKEKWEQFKGWMSNAWDNTKRVFGDFFSQAFEGVSTGGAVKWLEETWTTIKDKVSGWGSSLWNLFGPDVKKTFQEIWKGLVEVWDEVSPEIAKFGEMLKPMGEALGNLWKIMKPILAVIGGAILLVVEAVWEALNGMLFPAFEMIGKVLANVIQVIRGIFNIIIGIFTGDFGRIADGIEDIVEGLFGGVWAIIAGAAKMIWGAVKGLVMGIWDFFVWLYDELVGHSIVPDIVDGIVAVFKTLWTVVKWIWSNIIVPIYKLFIKLWAVLRPILAQAWGIFVGALKVLFKVAGWLWDNVLKPIWNKVQDLWPIVKAALRLWWAGIKAVWGVLFKVAKWLWEHVLKPIWNVVKKLWNDAVKPALKLWWAGIKGVWKILFKVAKWLWENVLKPIWNVVKKLWDNAVKPALKTWWKGITTIWKALWKVAQWVWDHVLKPVFEKVKEVWNRVRPELKEWWGRITSVWNKLKDLGSWIKNNVMDPIFTKIKDGWTRVKTWLENAKDFLKAPAEGIVNAVIKAVNGLIGGLNKISNILPGIEFHIEPIGLLAEGGPIPTRRVGSGFKTNGARAIVGEGKANYPEFVIPTDPTHRRRAIALVGQAQAKLGIPGGENLQRDGKQILKKAGLGAQTYYKGVPAYGLGGLIGDIGKGAWEAAKDLGKNAIGAAWNPVENVGENLIEKAGWVVPRSLGMYGLHKIGDWVTMADSGYEAAYEDAKKDYDNKGGKGHAAALKWVKGMDGAGYKMGGFSRSSIDCSGLMSGVVNIIKGRDPFSWRSATGAFPEAWGMKPGVGGGFTIGSTSNYGGSGTGHMAGTLQGVNIESSYPVGVHFGSGARGYNDSGFNEYAHLAKGAIVRARQHGTPVVVGEGQRDEAVIPLPRDWRSGNIGTKSDSGKTEVHLHGDLVLPNIKSGEDAQELIDNLKRLAED